jgi:hypothetical protein
MRPHEKLDLWQKGIDFVVEVYKITEDWPKEEKYGLTSQVRRAAVSVPANISEGAARFTNKEFAIFFRTPKVQRAKLKLSCSSLTAWATCQKLSSLHSANDMMTLVKC